MEQNLILIDINSNKYVFYDIKIEKRNSIYNIFVTTGKLGNKGITTIVYKNSNYTLCKSEFWKRVNDKKSKHFKNKDEIIPKINKLFNFTEYSCWMCGTTLEESLYRKIDSYLRNETKLDFDANNPLYKKVICFDCQKKKGLYKYNRADERNGD